MHPPGKHWVNDGERGGREPEWFKAARTCNPIEYLWLYLFVHFHYAWCFTWYALEMQYLHLKTKARLPTGALFASSFVWAIWRAGSYVHWQGWTEMGHTFSWKCGSVNFLLLCIWKNLSTSTLKSNRIIMKWTMTQHIEGVMQGEGSLDKIGIVRCSQKLPSFEQHQYCHRKFVLEHVSIRNAVKWWADERTIYL